MKILLIVLSLFIFVGCTNQEEAVEEAQRRIDNRESARKNCDALADCLGTWYRFSLNRYGSYTCELGITDKQGDPVAWNTQEFNIASLRYVCELAREKRKHK